jgi:hypothetical protein
MKLTILDEGVVWKNPYPSARALVAFHGHTVNLGGGELLHAARVAQAKTSRDGGCRMFRSRDHGKTWSETTPLVADGDRDPAWGYFTGLPRLTRDGTLWTVSIRFRLADPEDPRYTPDNGGWLGAQSFLCRSTDRGETWSRPEYLRPEDPPGGFHNVATGVMELDSGELMIFFEPFFTESLEKLRHEVVALYSRDQGRTWGDQTVIARDAGNRLIYFDPRLARLADGRWVCLFWTHEKQTDKTLNTTVAWSEDGRRWSEPVPTALWGFPTLPLTLPDGRLFAVYNYRREPQGVRAALSEDGGRTWDMAGERVLWDQAARRVTGELASAGQERRWEGSCMAEMFSWDFGVPDPTLLDDGSVLVTFYATQLDHVMHQRYVRVRID